MLREAIRLSPQSPQYFNTLGNALRQQGDLAAARTAFAEAARLNQRRTDLQAALFATNLGVQRLREGRLGEAVEQLTRATQLDPENRRAHHHLGQALQRQGKRAAAAASFKRARQIEEAEKAAPVPSP